MMRRLLCLSIMAVGWLAGCATTPENPSFPLTGAQARTAITAMTHEHRALPRPLVIIGGYMDPFFGQTMLAEYFKKVSPTAKVIPISLVLCGNLAECRSHVLAEVDEACKNNDPNWTAEVDVVGISLGGLVARYAAAPSPDPARPQRLRIARLFTLSSPLAGAKLAQLGLTQLQHELQPHSGIQKYLAAADPVPAYEIVSYVHLDDEIVGTEYSALPGRTPYWLPNVPWLPVPAHHQVTMDDRVEADITRRLLGETPFTQTVPAPLPATKPAPRRR